MAHQHPRGPLVPDPGDDIITGLDVMVSTSGLFRAVQNPAEARTLIANAAAKGIEPTSANPMFFSILGMLASANGSKKNGAYVLSPAMTAEWDVVPNAKNGQVALASGSYALLCESSKFEMRPYRRVVLAIGTLWGSNASGKNADLEVWINGSKGRAQIGEWDNQATAVAIGVIPANTEPKVSMWLLGTPKGTSIRLSADDPWSQLVVLALPAPEL